MSNLTFYRPGSVYVTYVMAGILAVEWLFLLYHVIRQLKKIAGKSFVARIVLLSECMYTILYPIGIFLTYFQARSFPVSLTL
jgi:hypothetical protein